MQYTVDISSMILLKKKPLSGTMSASSPTEITNAVMTT